MMKPLLSILCLLVTLATAAQAQRVLQQSEPAPAEAETADEAQAATPIAWPRSERPALTASVKQYMFDQMPVRELWVDATKLHGAMPVPGGWKVINSQPHESLAMVNMRDKSHRISFSLFGKQEFLNDLEDSSVRGYIAGVQAAFNEQVRIANVDNFRPSRAPHILDHGWCFVDYTLTLEETTYGVRDYLVMLDDYFLVIRHFGPPATVNAYQKNLQNLLGRSYLRGEDRR
ncbi:MAG: hypothetical protein ACFBZ8_03665 [Opitutales bacterium]